jgi:hypothetical protein
MVTSAHWLAVQEWPRRPPQRPEDQEKHWDAFCRGVEAEMAGQKMPLFTKHAVERLRKAILY